MERAVILSNDGLLTNPLRPSRSTLVVAFPPRTTLRDSERTLILEALEATGWIVGGPYGAAARLGLKRTTLIARMKKQGILRPVEEPTLDQAVDEECPVPKVVRHCRAHNIGKAKRKRRIHKSESFCVDNSGAMAATSGKRSRNPK